MHKTSLRKVGGSVMLTVPPVVLELMRLKAGVKVGLTVEQGRLIVEAETRPHYTLSELLADSDYSDPLMPEEREWIDSPPTGKELL